MHGSGHDRPDRDMSSAYAAHVPIPTIIAGSAETGPAGSARPRGSRRVDRVRELQPATSGRSDLIEFGLV